MSYKIYICKDCDKIISGDIMGKRCPFCHNWTYTFECITEVFSTKEVNNLKEQIKKLEIEKINIGNCFKSSQEYIEKLQKELECAKYLLEGKDLSKSIKDREIENLYKESQRLRVINTELERILRENWNKKETEQFVNFLKSLYGDENNK